MPIDLKTASALVKRHLGGVVVVFLLLGSAITAFGWNLRGEYKQLDEKRESLQAQERKLSQEQVDFEKYRAATETSLDKEKLDVDKREFIVNQMEKANQTQLATIQQRAQEYSDAFEKMHSEQEALSEVEQDKVADVHINQLISEFSSIGVNLSDSVNCQDKDAVAKYSKAKAKFDEIVGFAYAHQLQNKYRVFLNGQASMMDMSCRLD